MFGTIVIKYIKCYGSSEEKSKRIKFSRFSDESNPNYNTINVWLGVRMNE